MAINLNKMKIALIQMAVTPFKEKNLDMACKKIATAAKSGAQLVCLPECFNSPYGTQYFEKYAEEIPGKSTDILSAAAKENKVFLVGGSIPERYEGKLYNTCPVFDCDGKLLLKHRKIHLFDIDVPGKIRFKESEVLSAGSSFSVFETPVCKVGIGICYDIRFNGLAQAYAREGCKLLLYPGAFNMTTGPAHWEILQKARAVDNQLYVGGAAPARDTEASYVAWGHSSIIDPWGKVLDNALDTEKIIYADIDLKLLEDVRQSIPIAAQTRDDLYQFKYFFQ